MNISVYRPVVGHVSPSAESTVSEKEAAIAAVAAATGNTLNIT